MGTMTLVKGQETEGHGYATRELMTDVSEYAKDAGIYQKVFISPQVLTDIKDLPLGYEEAGELDVTRIMKILGKLRNALASVHWEQKVPFEAFLALKRDNQEGLAKPYPLIALMVLNSEHIYLVTPEEEPEEIELSEERREQIIALQQTLSPPRSQTFPRMN